MSTPSIRFKGFSGDWEQRKLGEYVKIYSGESPSKFEAGDELYVKVDDLNYNTKYITETQNKVSLHNTVHKVPKGSVAFPKRGAAIMTNKVRILAEDSYMDTNMMALSSDRINLEFLYNVISKEGLYRIADTSTVPQINNKHIEPYEVILPELEEQIRIGKLFENLDNLITLHQRKCDSLKQVKKYMLQKMFPKQGEKVPEIRFAGFTGDWKQRKLGDCANFRRGSFPQPYGNREWYDGDGAMPFVQVADVANDMKLVEDTKQKISQLAQPMSVFAEKGSILVTLQGSIGRVAITQYGAFVDRTVLIFDKYYENIDKVFWAYIIKEKFIEKAKKAPGGTIKTITKEVLTDFDLMMPNYEEQKRLGTYLSSLDNLIALHQRKSDSLKEIKKFMLQNMFPRG